MSALTSDTTFSPRFLQTVHSVIAGQSQVLGTVRVLAFTLQCCTALDGLLPFDGAPGRVSVQIILLRTHGRTSQESNKKLRARVPRAMENGGVRHRRRPSASLVLGRGASRTGILDSGEVPKKVESRRTDLIILAALTILAACTRFYRISYPPAVGMSCPRGLIDCSFAGVAVVPVIVLIRECGSNAHPYCCACLLYRPLVLNSI